MKENFNYFLSKEFRLDNGCDYNKDKFKRYLRDNHKELEIIYPIFSDTYFSYRMSYDKFQSWVIGTSIAILLAIFSFLITILINPNPKTFLIGSIFLFFISLIPLVMNKELKFKKKEAENLKQKDKCIRDVIMSKIDNKKQKK